MSVHDETWDRPICDFCKLEIPYEKKGKHRDGVCLKNKKCRRDGCNHMVAIYAHGLGWATEYCCASCAFQDR